jgi:protein TonB
VNATGTAMLPADRITAGQAALWAAAAITALAAHAGLGVWVARQPPGRPVATPAAVMIDLAPAPAAPEAETTRIAPDTHDAPGKMAPPSDAPPDPALPDNSAPVPEAPLPEPADVPRAEALPDIEPPPEVPEAEVAVLRPVARPPDLPPRPTPQRAQPQASPTPDANRARASTEALAPQPAAPRNSTAAVASITPEQWRSTLMKHLERHKRYPAGSRIRRVEGVAQVRFTIDQGGRVLSAGLDGSSGNAELDAEALALLRRASPVPTPPPGFTGSITAPIAFELR